MDRYDLICESVDYGFRGDRKGTNYAELHKFVNKRVGSRVSKAELNAAINELVAAGVMKVVDGCFYDALPAVTTITAYGFYRKGEKTVVEV